MKELSKQNSIPSIHLNHLKSDRKENIQKYPIEFNTLTQGTTYEKLQDTKNHLSDTTHFLNPEHRFGAVTFVDPSSNRFFCFGGASFLNVTTEAELESINTTLNFHEIADLQGEKWNFRYHRSLLKRSKNIKILEVNPFSLKFCTDMYVFDILTGNWSEWIPTGSIPPPSCFSASVTVNINKPIKDLKIGSNQKNQQLKLQNQNNKTSNTLKKDSKTFKKNNHKSSKEKNNNVEPNQTEVKEQETSTYIVSSLYLFGGYPDYYNRNLYKYSFKTNAWSIVKSKNVYSVPGRWSHQMVASQTSLYLLFGKGEEGCLKDIHEFNFETKTWNRLIPIGYFIPEGRYGHSAVYSKEYIYVFGGVLGSGKKSGELLEFSLKRNEWKKIQLIHELIPRGLHTSILINEKDFLLFGGASQNDQPIQGMDIVNIERKKKPRVPTHSSEDEVDNEEMSSWRRKISNSKNKTKKKEDSDSEEIEYSSDDFDNKYEKYLGDSNKINLSSEDFSDFNSWMNNSNQEENIIENVEYDKNLNDKKKIPIIKEENSNLQLSAVQERLSSISPISKKDRIFQPKSKLFHTDSMYQLELQNKDREIILKGEGFNRNSQLVQDSSDSFKERNQLQPNFPNHISKSQSPLRKSLHNYESQESEILETKNEMDSNILNSYIPLKILDLENQSRKEKINRLLSNEPPTIHPESTLSKVINSRNNQIVNIPSNNPIDSNQSNHLNNLNHSNSIHNNHTKNIQALHVNYTNDPHNIKNLVDRVNKNNNSSQYNYHSNTQDQKLKRILDDHPIERLFNRHKAAIRRYVDNSATLIRERDFHSKKLPFLLSKQSRNLKY